MTNTIPLFGCTTAEDLSFELCFNGMASDFTGRTFSMAITDRPSGAVKATLTIGAGLSLKAGDPNTLQVYLAKATMASWPVNIDYTADLIETTGGKLVRILPVRIAYYEPGRMYDGQIYRGAQVNWSSPMAVVTAMVGAIGPIGPATYLTIGTTTTLPAGSPADARLSGPAGAQVLDLDLPLSPPGAGGPTNPDILAIAKLYVLLAKLSAAGVPDEPTLIVDPVNGLYYAKDIYLGASLTGLVTALGGSFTRASLAWDFNATKALAQFANHVPRISYDPATGTLRGLRLEGSKINTIRNDTLAGAAVGSPGTLPTNWAIFDAAGLSSEVKAIGVSNGIKYVDIRLYGTTTVASARIRPESATQIVGAPGDVWTASFFASDVSSLYGGSLTNVTGVRSLIEERTAAGAFLAGTVGTTVVPGSSLSAMRVQATGTLSNAATERVVPQISVVFAGIGLAVDVTLRIGLPELVKAAYTTSPMESSGVALARSSELLTMPVTGWYNQAGGTLLTAAMIARTATSIAYVAELSDGTSSNRIINNISDADVSRATIVSSGTEGTRLNAIASPAAGTLRRVAHSFSSGGYAASGNGGAVVTATTPAVLPPVTQLRLGAAYNGISFLDGFLVRAIYWPTVLASSKLPLISGASL